MTAALVEVVDEPEILVLLRNSSTEIAKVTLKRVTERFGRHCDIRNLLLDRADLPSEARCQLMHIITEALTGLDFVRATVGVRRIERNAPARVWP